VASQGVAEKTGFRFEALTRNWEVDRDDNPIDAVMFAMTPDDLAELAVAADQRTASRLRFQSPRSLERCTPPARGWRRLWISWRPAN